MMVISETSFLTHATLPLATNHTTYSPSCAANHYDPLRWGLQSLALHRARSSYEHRKHIRTLSLSTPFSTHSPLHLPALQERVPLSPFRCTDAFAHSEDDIAAEENVQRTPSNGKTEYVTGDRTYVRAPIPMMSEEQMNTLPRTNQI